MRRLGSIVLLGAVVHSLSCGPGGPAPQVPSPTAPSGSAAPLPAPTAPPSASSSGVDANQTRDQIDEKFKWKLTPLFASDQAFDQGLADAKLKREALAKFQGSLQDPAKLEAALKLYFETRLLTNRLTLYASMRADTATKDTALQGMHAKSLDAMNALLVQSSMIRKAVLAMNETAWNGAFKKAKGLEAYRPYLEEVRRRRKHVLSEDAERVLTLAEDNLWAEIDLNELPSDHEKTFHSLLEEVPLPLVRDESGAQVQLTLSNFGRLRSSKDRSVREATVNALFGSLRKMENSLASTLAGQVRFNVFLARSRGYQTALDAYLGKDNIEPAVYHNLVRTVNANLAPLHRYVRLRKNLMNLKEVRIFDLYPPLVQGVDKRISYDQAREILPQALAPLGAPYIATLREGMSLDNGWVDLFPHANKRSGAFSSSIYGVHPFVKMNYFEQLDDLSTLAHEFGHALHSHLSMTHQPYVTSGYSAFNAEIASTLNEKLLSDHLVKTASSDAERLYILSELAETIRTTIYRQTLFSEFELTIHTAAEKGTPLTAEYLNGAYLALVKKYYGPDFTVGEHDAVEWSYVPHFYYKYYMYSYATGLSAGIALADLVSKGQAQRDAYLKMLSSGNSRPPVVLLRDAGVDMTKPDAIEAAARLLDQTLSEMERLASKK